MQLKELSGNHIHNLYDGVLCQQEAAIDFFCVSSAEPQDRVRITRVFHLFSFVVLQGKRGVDYNQFSL